METFLLLNEHEMTALMEEQEDVILQVAAGKLGREEFTAWLRRHVIRRELEV